MLVRLVMLIMISVQVLFFVPGCEQIKDYRKRAYYEKGLKRYEAQQYREALKQTGFALEFDDDYVNALALRGLCQYELMQYESAATDLEKAASLDTSRDDLLTKAAESFFKARKPGRARGATEILLAADPNNSKARYINARIRIRSRNLSLRLQAKDVLEPLLKDTEYSDEAFALLAQLHILDADLEKAELILMEHAAVNDDWFFAMRLLAQKYDYSDDLLSAIRVYKKLVELQPDSTQDLQQLISFIHRVGMQEEGRQFLVSLIAAHGQQIRYKLELINFYIHYGQFAEAEEAIRAGLKESSGYFDFSHRLIDVYEKTNRYEEAIQVTKDVLARIQEEEDLGRQIEFMNILARLYYNSNNLEMAKFAVRWSLYRERDNHAARFMSARINLDEGKTLLAIAEFRVLRSEDITNPEYDYYMGLAHVARGEGSNAEQSFKDALGKNPAHKQAFLKISEIYYEKEFFSDVERMINEFLAFSPGDPDVLALQAEIAKKMVVSSEAG